MRQQFFEEQREPDWIRLARILDGLDAGRRIDARAFPDSVPPAV